MIVHQKSAGCFWHLLPVFCLCFAISPQSVAQVVTADYPPTWPSRSDTTNHVVAASTTEPATGVIDGAVSLEIVAGEINAVEGLAELEPELKADLLARLKKSSDWLRDEKTFANREAELRTEIAAIPNKLSLIDSELASVPEPVPPKFADGTTVAQLEAKLGELKQQCESHAAHALVREQECQNRPERMAQIGKESIETEKKIEDAKQQLGNLTGTDLASRVKRIEQQARIRVRQQQLQMLKAELQHLDAIIELLPKERDLAKRTASNSKKQLQAWQTAVDARRKQESQRQATEARRVAANSHPALKSLATNNAEIAELRIKTAAEIERLAATIKELNELSASYKKDFDDLQKKVQHAGTTSSTGILIRQQRDELPAATTFQERAAYVATAMPQAHLKLLEFDRLREEIVDPVEKAAEIVDPLSDSLAQYDPDQVLSVVTQLLHDRKEFLDKASADQNTYLRDLNELELVNQALTEQVEEFRLFLDQRIMWIRSAERMTIRDIREAGQGLMILVSPGRWIEVLKVGGIDLLRRPAGWIAVVSLFILLLLGRAKLLSTQLRLMKNVAEDEVAKFWPKVASLLIAVVLSARWPVLLLVIGVRLNYAAGTTPWTHAVGQSCLVTMAFLWGWEIVREICRHGGIGERLFAWPPEATLAVRRSSELTLLLGTPLLSLLQLSQFEAFSEWNGLERSLFIITLSLCSLQLGVLLSPRGVLLRALAANPEYSKSIFYSARNLTWLAATLAPLLLAVLSMAGYHYSAYQLSARLMETGGVIVAIIVMYNLSLCWLDVKAHNLSRSVDGHEEDELEDTDHEDPNPIAVENEDDFPPRRRSVELDPQESFREFRDILQYTAVMGLILACWFIWASVLPAVRILDKVELWQNMETLAETVTDEDGQQVLRMTEQSVPTTLTDLLAALLVCFATVTIGRKLPGLLQLTLLERIPLDSGGRQAISILSRYSATMAGALFACSLIRVSWSSVQWLAAAMTVGLGFGLQEIFANLVSGLIILFERPVRMGDLVTVGDVTGTVTRMQIRATTITDYDRRELIVPNKTFITDKVVNWTLSDPISRIVLRVGVAYGTDVKKVRNILLRIAGRSSIVLDDPAPFALFKGFGDSNLDLELRVFIPKRDVYLEAVNDLNAEIAREFERAGIEIAFPQRDLRIRSIEGLQENQTVQSRQHAKRAA